MKNNKKEKPVQYFSKEYLNQCKKMTTPQIVKFLEDFRELHLGLNKKEKSTLISIRIDNVLLQTLKTKAELEDKPYQTMIKEILKQAI